ncbi:uncharacterized protein RCC_05606 [Ramularia collo-cygni]|uniref:AB hydrolase-1 domain-containing protein n=1 Tax=Ramularia collo-cygni TaxID=112498 RepID=A0A2D3UTI9_9PEZI|nr:uncharacterized protein RCC_05606 [Ramularia collo-cygni]CZT19751.1 uncharacterized protein RCC_05606 [Ramularia collo-cygni]
MVQIEEYSFTYSTNAEKKTTYLAAGPKDGPLLIFVHGWPAIAKTWKVSLEFFANSGFRAVAPDMPGYGGSTARKVTEDYSLEQINLGMVALIDHLGRDKAIWIGHDWGCGAVWSFAEHYPERCVAAAGLAVPSHIIEKGLDELVKTINRDIYPEDKHPYGQWSYQKFYEDDFEKATAWFEKNPAAFLRAGYSKGRPDSVGKPAILAGVKEAGGWFGGIAEPDPNWKHIPLEATVFESEEMYNDVVEAMERTGFWGADSWYSSHAANRAYFDKAANNGELLMPTLFIGATYDTVCDTVTSTAADNQKKYSKNLTEASVDAGHWVYMEKPDEVNAIIAKWIEESCKESWPGNVKPKV